MTIASQITVARLLLVPVYAWLALVYGHSVSAGRPEEWVRWLALLVFVVAAASDGIDGWVARRFNQRSDFGAFVDPLADKSLLLVAVLVLWWVDWGENGWRVPGWYAALVLARDAVILGGITILYGCRRKVRIAPSWSGKICTVMQMTVIGWVMLGWIRLSPAWPCGVSAIVILWSGVDYVRQGWAILHGNSLPLR